MTTRIEIAPDLLRGNAPAISDQQWWSYFVEGWLPLGELLSADEVTALRTRVDNLALGRVDNAAVEIQRDTGGRYEDLPEATGSVGRGTLLYRKVQGLETDDLFSAVLHRPIFAEIATHHYGRHAPVSLFRAMVMNKPAGQGTVLPWHQDGGDVWALDRDPLVTIWIALDPATVDNGCVEVIPRSHRLGLLRATGSTISAGNATQYCSAELVHPLEMPAGHGVLIHNWLIHRSGVNPTGVPRRAFTACYLDGRTRGTLTGQHYPCIIGSPPSTYPFLGQLQSERDSYQRSATTAEEYARSLQADNAALQSSLATASTYAHSLEAEISKMRPVAGPALPQRSHIAGAAKQAARLGRERVRRLARLG
jgi:Phytanoyl-CoA dioxygenase (PhyH)